MNIKARCYKFIWDIKPRRYKCRENVCWMGFAPPTNVLSYKLFYNGNQNFQLELQSARIVFEVVKIVGYPCELVYVCLTVVWLICTYMVFHIWYFPFINGKLGENGTAIFLFIYKCVHAMLDPVIPWEVTIRVDDVQADISDNSYKHIDNKYICKCTQEESQSKSRVWWHIEKQRRYYYHDSYIYYDVGNDIFALSWYAGKFCAEYIPVVFYALFLSIDKWHYLP